MLTWRLWREINRPTPLTALYYRLHLRRAFIEQRGYTLGALSIFKTFGLTVLPVIFIFLGVPLLFISSATMLRFTALLIPLAITGYGLAHCVAVSTQLVQERERSTYDLLCVSPPGRMGLHWAYTVSWLVNHRTFRWMVLIFISLGMFAALLGIAGNLLLVPSPLTRNAPLNISRLLGTAASMLSFWLDYAQTIILSSLIAMYVGGVTDQVSTARLLAGGMFLTLQAVIYLLRYMIMLVFFASFLNTEPMPPIEYETRVAVITIVTVIITYLMRDYIIWLLWKVVVRTLNASPSELDTLIHRKL